MRRDDGFTLAEAMVALLILAIAMTALFAAFSSGLRHALQATRLAQATETARSLLQGAGIERPLAEGVEQGRSPEGFHWRIEVVRRKVPEILESAPAVAAYWVTVTAGPQAADPQSPGAVTLTTLRLQVP